MLFTVNNYLIYKMIIRIFKKILTFITFITHFPWMNFESFFPWVDFKNREKGQDREGQAARAEATLQAGKSALIPSTRLCCSNRRNRIEQGRDSPKIEGQVCPCWCFVLYLAFHYSFIGF